MKRVLWKIIGGTLVCLVLVLLVLRVTGLEPRGGRPGLWLNGDLVTTPVVDWSFTDNIPTIEIQTRTWYLIPHSVTINCTLYNGQLYLDSHDPRRNWDANVHRDPHVRLKIGNQLYDRTLFYVTDPAEHDAVIQAKSKKYPKQKMPPNAVVYRVMPN